jgi:hypothetical protein
MEERTQNLDQIQDETSVQLLDRSISKNNEITIAWENINVFYNRQASLFDRLKNRIDKNETPNVSKHIINNGINFVFFYTYNYNFNHHIVIDFICLKK